MAVPPAMRAVPHNVSLEGCSKPSASPTASVTMGVAAFMMLINATAAAVAKGATASLSRFWLVAELACQ